MADPRDPQLLDTFAAPGGFRPGAPAAPPPPPTPAVPFWRRAAEAVGVDDEIEAISRLASSWRAPAPSQAPTPEEQARWAPTLAALQKMKAQDADLQRQRQATWAAVSAPVKRLFGAPAVQEYGQELKQNWEPLWKPTEAVSTVGNLGRQHITQQSDALRRAVRQALPETQRTLTGSGPLRGLSADVNPVDWMLGAQRDWLPNLALDTAIDATTPVGAALNLDLPIGPAVKAAAPFLAKVGGAVGSMAAAIPPGFYSRVDEVAKRVPAKGIHPNKLLSWLKNDASGEEVGYRGLPDFIAGKGNSLILPEELQAHLAANPAPALTRTVLGASTDPAHVAAARDLLAHGSDHAEALTALQQAYRGASDVELRDALDAAQLPNYPAGPPKYESYSLPGGENYRESLTQLAESGGGMQAVPHPSGQGFALQRPDGTFVLAGPETASPGAVKQWTNAAEATRYGMPVHDQQAFRSSHWDQPNVLVHTRSNERTLPPAPMRSLQEVEQIIQDVVGVQRPEHIASGGPQMAVRQGLITHDEAALYGQSRGFTNYPHAPTGPRGRFLEELQSDLHQQGKKQGYQQPLSPAEVARLDELNTQIEQARRGVTEVDQASREAGRASQVAMNAYARQFLPPAYAHFTSLGDALRAEGQGVEGARVAWHAAIDRAAQAFRRAPGASGTPDLAALHQAEEAAGQRLQAAVDHITALQNEQHTIYDKTQKGVPDMPFKETWPDLALKQELLDVAHRRDLDWLGFSSGKTQVDRYGTERLAWAPEGRGFRVSWEPQVGGDALGGDLGADALAQGLITNSSDYVETPEQLARLLGGSDVKADKAWKRIQAQPEGGLYLPRKEGMEAFYDQALPGKLRKLLNPFGGTVERGAIPVTKETIQDVSGFSVRDNEGYMRGWFPTRVEADAYIASPPPQMTNYVSREGGATVVPAVGGRPVKETVDEPAWLTRLSPEMKARMREKGFPLLNLFPPALLGGAAAASQLSDDEDTRALGAGFGMAALPFLPGGKHPFGRALARDVAAAAERRGVRAFHGSPHDFDRFDLSKIGTGEGAAAYGHGLYFAENENVAKGYRDRLSGRGGIIPGASQGRGQWLAHGVPVPEGIAGHKALDTAQDIQGLLYYQKHGYADMAAVSRANIERRLAHWRATNPQTGIADTDMRALADYYETHLRDAPPEAITQRPPGRMYEVNLNVDPEHLLDWDQPISAQTPAVQERLRAAFANIGRPDPAWADWARGQHVYTSAGGGDYAQASRTLQRAGIPGLRYLDQGSRTTGAGTHNYTMFDDAPIDILRKYGFFGPVAAGAAASQLAAGGPGGDPNR